ncbi:MAG TPA: hypothetical protein VE980_24595 [Pyrinomonadaceae bacterium]|nr:hypothetical protein [Pyrinomonadaceae bacterium]
MNLSLAFFHGEQALVALVLGGLIIVIAVPLVFYVWLRHSKSSELKLTYIYVLSTAVFCALMALTTYDEVSLFHLTVATVAFILTLPWNLITLFVVSFAGNSDIGNGEILSAMLLGAGVNAWILFFLAKKAKKNWKV